MTTQSGRVSSRTVFFFTANRDRGAVFALLAISLVGLIAAMAAALDVGRLVGARQQMQMACDLAATAGVSTMELTKEEVWDTAARYYAANVYGTSVQAQVPQLQRLLTDPNFPGQNTGAEYAIGDHVVQVRNPYRDSATDTERLDPSHIVHVRATRIVGLPIAAVVGVEQATVAAQGAAVQRDSDSGIFIFANAQGATQVGVNISSSGATIVGGVHSNTRIDITGSGTSVNGWLDYRHDYRVAGSQHTFTKGFRVGNIMELPLHFTPADFEPYDFVVADNLKFNKQIPAGVYYVDGNLRITGDDVPLGPVTFVVKGLIDVTGSGHNLTAARNNVLFYSLSANKTAIDVRAQGARWEGYIFAPVGGISFSGRGMTTYNGGIVGDTVSFSASGFTGIGQIPSVARDFSRLFR